MQWIILEGNGEKVPAKRNVIFRQKGNTRSALVEFTHSEWEMQLAKQFQIPFHQIEFLDESTPTVPEEITALSLLKEELDLLNIPTAGMSKEEYATHFQKFEEWREKSRSFIAGATSQPSSPEHAVAFAEFIAEGNYEYDQKEGQLTYWNEVYDPQLHGHDDMPECITTWQLYDKFNPEGRKISQPIPLSIVEELEKANPWREATSHEKMSRCDGYSRACTNLSQLLQSQPVKTNEDINYEQAREIAKLAWTAAANAYRMYPDNKHTFFDYWDDYGKLNLPKAAPLNQNEDILVKALEKISISRENANYIAAEALSSYRTSVNENAKCDDWINVKDKLPGYDTLVLWYPVVGNMFIDMLDKDGSDWLDHCLFWKYITYEPDVDTESEQYKKATSAYEKFTSNSSSTSVKGEDQEKGWIELMQEQIDELEKVEGAITDVKKVLSSGIAIKFQKNAYWLRLDKQSKITAQ